MEKKFVDELHWIEEQEMMDLTAIAQSSPGAIAVNASILVGYHVAGVIGALITVVGTVLPPIIIISVISFFYAAFRDNVIVNMAMTGMLAGVAAVICDVVITMGKSIFQKKKTDSADQCFACVFCCCPFYEHQHYTDYSDLCRDRCS